MERITFFGHNGPRKAARTSARPPDGEEHSDRDPEEDCDLNEREAFQPVSPFERFDEPEEDLAQREPEGLDSAEPDPTGPPSFSGPSTEGARPQEEETEEDSYGSLIGMTGPFGAPKKEFVRTDKPETRADEAEPMPVDRAPEETEAPAVSRLASPRLFDPPSEGPAPSKLTPSDIDSALRAALAQLRQVNGTA